MPSYIQVAIAKVKAVDLEMMKTLRKKGHKTIRFRLEEESKAKRKPATASVPIAWILDTRERFAATNKDDVFKDFVSDWVSNWV